MCQITPLGSCHFDAIRTKDACHSCTDGFMAPLLMPILLTSIWFHILTPLVSDCFNTICWHLFPINHPVSVTWCLQSMGKYRKLLLFNVSSLSLDVFYDFIIPKRFGRKRKPIQIGLQTWLPISHTAHTCYCFFIQPAPAATHKYGSSPLRLF